MSSPRCPHHRFPPCADSSPNLGPSKPPKEGFYSADPSPPQPGCATPLTVDTVRESPPPLELPAPSPNCERSTRDFGGGKRVSFAEDQSSGCGPSGSEAEAEAAAEAAAEATGYATDDEAEGGRRLWGAALERARYSPTRRDGTAHDAENRPAQRSNAHTVQEEGVAEALVLAACPSSAQVMPLMLLLSAGTA